jgi:hypothetical protein
MDNVGSADNYLTAGRQADCLVSTENDMCAFFCVNFDENNLRTFAKKIGLTKKLCDPVCTRLEPTQVQCKAVRCVCCNAMQCSSVRGPSAPSSP